MKTELIAAAGIIAVVAGTFVFYLRSKKNKTSQKIQPQTNTTRPDTSKE